jgi:hypothetical protein
VGTMVRHGFVLVVGLSLLVAACTSSLEPGGVHVLGPAPTPCRSPIGGLHPVRSPSIFPAARLLGDHVPRWVPPGFGVAEKTVLGHEGEIRWTDAKCRAVWLSYRPVHAPPMQGDPFGRWTVHLFPEGGMVYQVDVPNGTLVLAAAHVSRGTVDRVVKSVPL